ncbi:hypothetical protein [Sphingomonas crocodyli]|uniref:Uncharacterized protein n=1 Tax=Sphingomonas crocodyli TaxID=1979270 RepID=A0A437LYE9_9SPHN|nr:hypothetical protein [Sphingomonas crocodyli]RVT90459.1 hypothetical protein EOD43_19595 [Sphingomonas crocodyli]
MPLWMWIEPLSATISIHDLEAAFPNPEQKNSAGLFMEHRTAIERCVRRIAGKMRVRPDEPLKITAADLADDEYQHDASDRDAPSALADMKTDRSIALAAKASVEPARDPQRHNRVTAGR